MIDVLCACGVLSSKCSELGVDFQADKPIEISKQLFCKYYSGFFFSVNSAERVCPWLETEVQTFFKKSL